MFWGILLLALMGSCLLLFIANLIVRKVVKKRNEKNKEVE